MSMMPEETTKGRLAARCAFEVKSAECKAKFLENEKEACNLIDRTVAEKQEEFDHNVEEIKSLEAEYK